MFRTTKILGRIHLTLSAEFMGADINVSLYGGSVPHIGATALAEPRESLKRDGSISASCSVLTLLGHKEDEVARHTALTLAAHANARVAVSCGIHLPDIASGEIAETRKLVDDMVRELMQAINQRARLGRPEPRH